MALDWLPMSPLHRLGGAQWGLASLLSCAACAACPSGILSPIAARACHVRGEKRGENALEVKSQF